MLLARRSELSGVQSVVGSETIDAPRLRSVYASTSGWNCEIRSEYLDAISALIAEVRTTIATAKDEGRYIAYLSVPISPKGGGHFETNNAIASFTAAALESRFGGALMVVNSAAYNLPPVGGSPAAGGEYMAAWSDVIAGVDGKGDVFDMVYFVGPSDVWSFFGLKERDALGELNRWVDTRASSDPAFKQFIETGSNRRQFVRYYALRGSAAYSKGSHDEWNIVASLNSRRPIGDDIAVYFDGHPIEPGDYDDLVDSGYRF